MTTPKVRCWFPVLLLVLIAGSALLAAAEAPLRCGLRLPQDAEGMAQPTNWQIEVKFSAPVSSLDLARFLEIHRGGVKTGFELVNAVGFDQMATQPLPLSRTTFFIAPKPVATDAATFTVEIRAGLPASDGSKLIAATRRTFRTSPTVYLQRSETFVNDSERGVSLFFSSEVPVSRIRDSITILPPVRRRKIEQGADQRTIKVTGRWRPGQNYRIEIEPTPLWGGLATVAAASASFAAPTPAPEVRFYTPVSVLELKGRQLLPIAARNMAQVRCEITAVPAFFAAEFLHHTIFATDDRASSPSKTDRFAPGSDDDRTRENWDKISNRLVEILQQVERLKPQIAASRDLAPLAGALGDVKQATEIFPGDARPEVETRLSLPLTFRDPPTRGGAFLVMVDQPKDDDNAFCVRMIQITDLSITYRRSEGQLLAWVTRIHTGEPVADAGVLATTQGDRRILLGRTDRDGLLLVKADTLLPGFAHDAASGALTATQTALAPADVIALTAFTPEDACVVALDSNRIVPSGIVRGESKTDSLDGARGHVFTERGIYRPGERAFFKVTVRRFSEGRVESPDGRVVKLEVTDCRDNTLLDEELRLSAFGTASASVQIPDTTTLGQCTVKVRFPTDQTVKRDDDDEDRDVLAATTFMVQEFERPRHYAELAIEQGTTAAKGFVGISPKEDFITVKLAAKYYAGGPVRAGKVSWRASLVPNQQTVEGFDAYLFGNTEPDDQVLESGEGMLDRTGTLEVRLPLDPRLLSGLFAIEVAATVLDIDGRPATGRAVYTPKAPIKVGIHRHPTLLNEGDGLPLQIVALDANNRLLGRGKARVDILQERWFYTQKRDLDGNLRYRWDKGWARALSTEVDLVDGRGTCDLGFANGGDYRIQVSVENADGVFSSRSRLTVGYSYDDDEDRKRRGHHELLLMTDRSTIKAGQKIGLEFQTPRPARFALITAERQGIYAARVVPITNKRSRTEWQATADWRPNVYLSVVVPAGRDGFPVYRSQVDSGLPTTFFGVTNVKVIDEVAPLAVAIAPQVPDLKAHPGDSMDLEFVVTDERRQGCEAELAVAVVDEAVLALTSYQTPNLSRLTDFTVPLAVVAGDLRYSLISQDLHRLLPTRILTGGGEGTGALASDLALRKDFRPVAFFEPMLRTSPDGRARVGFKLPDSTTTYRVFVVACNRTAAFCSVERPLLVNKEFFFKPALPRFLVAGDQAQVPVALCNQTPQAGTVRPAVGETRNLTLKFETAEANVPGYDQAVVPLSITAGAPSREAFLTLQGRMGDVGDAIRLDLPVLSPYIAVHRRYTTLCRDQGEIKVDVPAAVRQLPATELAGNVEAALALSATPFSRLTATCRYLLQYPHGCIEQTSSGIIPLAGLRQLVQDGLIPGITVAQIDQFLKPGLKRLFSMQTRGGGFAYWPGESSPSWWGSLYAVFALGMVERSGYELPAGPVLEAVKYVREGITGKKAGANYHGYGIDELAVLNLALHRALTKEILTEAGKSFKSRTYQGDAAVLWAEQLSGLTPATGLKNRLAKLDPRIDRDRHGWADNSIREMAMCLLAATAIDPKSPLADKWAGALVAEMKDDGRFVSTADTGITLLALGSYYQALPRSAKETTCTVTLGGAAPQTVNLTDKGIELALDAAELFKAGKVGLTVKGAQPVHAQLNLTYPDLASRTDELGRGLAVQRSYTNLNGSGPVRVGDIVRVDLTFQMPLDPADRDRYRRLDYVALEDALPAGFVAINSVLATEGDAPGRGKDDDDDDDDNDAGDDGDWVSWEDGFFHYSPNRVEFRDDRVLAYRDRLYLWRHDPVKYSYYARAVCPGTFRVRPSRVSLLYDPEVFGLAPATTLTIEPAVTTGK